MTKLQSIYISLRAADEWEKKGQPAWVSRCLSSALMDYLSIAAQDQSDAEAAGAWLREQGLCALLSQQFEATQRLVIEIDAGRLPGASLGGNYEHLVLAHLAWALDETSLGEPYVGIAVRPDVMQISTPFWREYATAMKCLVDGRTYRRRKLRVRGLERYWVAYLHLIEQATQAGDLSAALAQVDRAFAERNRDDSIQDDAHEIEGSGSHPVRWDFRRDSLLKYIRGMTEHEPSN